MSDQAGKLREAVSAKSDEMLRPPQTNARVLTITSGKGGVGKTNLAVNLGLSLIARGKRVVILDADFGLANIELILGVIPKSNLADVILGDKSIEDVIINGPMGIKFISGGTGLRELANLKTRQMAFLIQSFKYLDEIADIIIIDTSAGISNHVVNFVRAAGEAIVVTTPEPTSITDAYALIKTTVEDMGRLDLSIKVIINRTETPDEGREIFLKLKGVAERFLDLDIKYLGSIPFDRDLVKAVKSQRPALLSYPNSQFSRAVNALGAQLLDAGGTAQAAEKKGMFGFFRKLVGIK